MPSIELNGIDVHYLAPRGLRRDAARIALLVHGVAGSSAHYEPLLAHLGGDVVPIAVDLPGHGGSGGSALPTVEDIVGFLDALLAALEIEGPVGYVGHSFGGLIGLMLALRYPERVDRLVLIAAAASFRLHPDFAEQLASGRWNLAAFRDSFAPDIPEDKKQLVLRDLPRTRVDRAGATLSNWSRVDLRACLGSVRIPTLVIVPEDDVILSPRHERRLAWEIPRARLLAMPRGGHYVHVEQPALVAAAITDFLGAGQTRPVGEIAS